MPPVMSVTVTLVVCLLMLATAVAYVAHVVWSILLLKAADSFEASSGGRWVLALVGVVVAPIGVLHGLMLAADWMWRRPAVSGRPT